MARSKVKLMLTGFDDYLEKIQKASGSIDRAAEQALKDGANALVKEYETQARAAGVPQRSIDALTVDKPQWSGNRVSISAGFKLGEYNAKNPSGGYIAMFENYGTKERKTKGGKSRGKIRALGFIQRAEKRAAPKVKKAEQDALEKILQNLE